MGSRRSGHQAAVLLYTPKRSSELELSAPVQRGIKFGSARKTLSSLE
jgi:hypothetical protein